MKRAGHLKQAAEIGKRSVYSCENDITHRGFFQEFYRISSHQGISPQLSSILLDDHSRSTGHSDRRIALGRLQRHVGLQDGRGNSTHLLILVLLDRVVETPLLVNVLVHGNFFAENVGQQAKGRERDGDEPDESKREDKGVNDLRFQGFGEGVQHRDGSVGAVAEPLLAGIVKQGFVVQLTHQEQNRIALRTQREASS
jgi:hypothetical protein